MSGEFDRKARCVAQAWAASMENPQAWQSFTKQNELGLPFAHLYVTKLGTLNKQGKFWVEQTYDRLLSGLGIEESDYYDFSQMQEAYYKSQEN